MIHDKHYKITGEIATIQFCITLNLLQSTVLPLCRLPFRTDDPIRRPGRLRLRPVSSRKNNNAQKRQLKLHYRDAEVIM